MTVCRPDDAKVNSKTASIRIIALEDLRAQIRINMIRLILNLLWLVFGGFVSGVAWLFGGLLLALTIVGLPWAFAAWRIAAYSFWPFGREIVWRDPDPADLGQGCLGVGMNVIWLVVAGWWIALAHLMIAVAEFVSIIGIPFALKDLELAKLALAPVGRTIREKP